MKSFLSFWCRAGGLVALPAEEEAESDAADSGFEASMMSSSHAGSSLDGFNPFDKIPNELLVHIASFLSAKQLCKFGTVCKRWFDVANDQRLWKDLCGNELRISIITNQQTEHDYVGLNWRLAFVRFQKNYKEIEPTYHDATNHVLGCPHYQRCFKIKPVCCGRWSTCRLCHDQQNNHVMDRFATQEMICMRCKTIQPVGAKCMSHLCRHERPVRHYCPICKLWEDNERKEIFHCPSCGICRLGKQSSYVHCFKCSMCVHKYIYNTHNCKAGQTKLQCPVCLQGPLWNSLQPILFLPCGDAMHSACAQQLLDNNRPCPVCNVNIHELLLQQHMQLHHPQQQQQQQQQQPQQQQPHQE